MIGVDRPADSASVSGTPARRVRMGPQAGAALSERRSMVGQKPEARGSYICPEGPNVTFLHGAFVIEPQSCVPISRTRPRTSDGQAEGSPNGCGGYPPPPPSRPTGGGSVSSGRGGNMRFDWHLRTKLRNAIETSAVRAMKDGIGTEGRTCIQHGCELACKRVATNGAAPDRATVQV